MSRFALVSLLALTACVSVQRGRHGECSGDCATIDLINAGLSIAADALTDDPMGPLCDPQSLDPVHTCPDRAAEPR